MSDNSCQNWAKGLRIIQSTKNRSFHTGIKRTPYEAMFGTPQKNGLLDSCLDTSTINKIKTEEELEEHLELMKQSLEKADTVPETLQSETGKKQMEIQAQDDGSASDNVDLCIVCDQKYALDNVCIECNQPFHVTCGADSDVALCKLCGNKKASDTQRQGCKRGLQEQAEKMLAQSRHKFPPVDVGDNVLITTPDVDRGRLAPRNILAVVMERADQGLYTLGTKNGNLKKLYSRNEFQLAPSGFLSLAEIPSGSSVDVRQEAMLSSGSKQGFVRCNCLKGCQTKACACIKSNIKCNSKCHRSSSCKNK